LIDRRAVYSPCRLPPAHRSQNFAAAGHCEQQLSIATSLLQKKDGGPVSNDNGLVRLDFGGLSGLSIDWFKVGSMETARSFRALEENANTAVGTRKANDLAGVTNAPGTSFGAQAAETDLGPQSQTEILAFDGHSSHLCASDGLVKRRCSSAVR
jgi:hypothetical protein